MSENDLDRLTFYPPKWLKEAIRAMAEANGMSMSTYVNTVLAAEMTALAEGYEATESVDWTEVQQQVAAGTVPKVRTFGGVEFEVKQ